MLADVSGGYPRMASDGQVPTSFPPVEWEEQIWAGGSIASLGPSSTHLSQRGRTYRSAVPSPIADFGFTTERETALLAREAEFELIRFDSESGIKLRSFAPILLRSEAASSSQIENLTASARAVFTAEAGGKAARNAGQVSANSRAMIAAIDRVEHVNLQAILGMHAELMRDEPRHTPGQLRDEPVWIGARAQSPIGADFVAPHHTRLEVLMSDLVRFANRTDLPPLEQVAVTHAQFETIHPFSDGNGRTGRALAQTMLRSSGLTRNVVVPVSAGLLLDVDGYHAALSSYRDGDHQPIVLAFASAALRAVPNGRQLVADLERIAEQWQQASNVRPGSVREAVLTFALERPVFTAEQVAGHLNRSPSNIYRYLQGLAADGVLAVGAEYRGPKLWRAPDVLAAIDAFAQRAGRRGF